MRLQTTNLSLSNPFVTLTLQVRPSFVSRMRVISHELAGVTRAEDGCLFSLAAESSETGGLFLIASAWRDIEAYEKHRTSPYVRAFESQIVPEILLESPTFHNWQKMG
ncbi:MAG: antibiotic biosynthesis monooxygenase [Methanoregula sp.]|jgi:quinol monooxygenase YgiN|nr:antibiotic biosynthesis monooxygenase [Methanoregula sp.]